MLGEVTRSRVWGRGIGKMIISNRVIWGLFQRKSSQISDKKAQMCQNSLQLQMMSCIRDLGWPAATWKQRGGRIHSSFISTCTAPKPSSMRPKNHTLPSLVKNGRCPSRWRIAVKAWSQGIGEWWTGIYKTTSPTFPRSLRLSRPTLPSTTL